MSGTLSSYFSYASAAGGGGSIVSTPVTFVGVSSVQNQTASTTALAPALTTLQVNDRIIAFASWKPSGNQTPTTTIASGTGATVSWTDLGVWSQPATTTATDVLTRAWLGTVSAVTTGSSTTTVTFSAAAINALQVRSFRNMSTAQAAAVVQGRGNSTVNGFAAVNSPSALSGDLVIAYTGDNSALATASYSASTTNGTWSTGLTTEQGSADGSNPMLMSQYKILTGSGTTPATIQNTGGTAAAWAYQIFAFSQLTTATSALTVTATNATIFSDATYYYAAYTTPGTFTNDFTVSGGALQADILVVGGGGGAPYGNGNAGGAGGGGGGGYVYLTSQTLVSGTHSATVGAVGAAAVQAGNGGSGGNSQFNTLTAAVGGGGGGYTAAGSAGGSGGGGGTTTTTGGTATTGQGFAGGVGRQTTTKAGGGGGGAGGVGGAAASNLGGNGGAGLNTWASWLTAISAGTTYISCGGAGTSAVGGSTGGTPGNDATGYLSGSIGMGGRGVDIVSLNSIVSDGGPGAVIIRYARSQIVGGQLLIFRFLVWKVFRIICKQFIKDSRGH